MNIQKLSSFSSLSTTNSLETFSFDLFDNIFNQYSQQNPPSQFFPINSQPPSFSNEKKCLFSKNLLQEQSFNVMYENNCFSFPELNSQQIFNSIEQISLPSLPTKGRQRSAPPPGFSLPQSSPSKNKHRKVVYIRGFDNPMITLENIANLLRNFGHVVRMLLIREKNALLAEFFAHFDASRCKQLCEGMQFCGNNLSLFWSNYDEIEYKPSEKCEFWQEELRNEGEKLPSINCPSKTVHIGNLPIEACNENFMKNYLFSVGEIKKIQFQKEKPNKNMCFIEFANLNSAIQVVSFYHNLELFGRNITASFTKTLI